RRRARARRPLGAADDALRPRLSARAPIRTVLVSQAPADVQARELELGAAAGGTSRAALAAYVDGVAAVLRGVAPALRPGAPVVIVVNDRRDLYPAILERAGLRLEERLRRHVNRRTGRRSGEFYEDVLVARAK